VAFFTYRSLDDLRAAICEQGVDLACDEEIRLLTQPIAIGRRVAGNRMAVHPMEGCDGTPDGRPGELTFRRWRRFAEGGAKLIWGEATAISPEGRANPGQLLLSEATAPDFRRLLAETRQAHRRRFGRDDDLLVGIQLTHSGRWSHSGPVVVHHAPTVDAVTWLDRARGERLPPDYPLVSDAELEALGERFVEAAVLAARIGFDFVDIKQCHTYLLSELLAARDRPGRYGGPFENRCRLVLDIVREVRARLGDDLLLATRLNIYDGVPFGQSVRASLPYEEGWGVDGRDPSQPDVSEPIRLVALLKAQGLRLVNLTMGSPYFNPHVGRPFERPPVDGYPSPEHPLQGVERHVVAAAALQQAHPDVAMVGTGYSWLRHFALNVGEASVRTRRISIVGLGRGALAYPEFAADVLCSGRMSPSRACLGVSYCTALMRAKNNELGQFPVGCVPRDPLYVPYFRQAYPRR
jgi:2,4-dienoyl-CoA reductase-like NADH-dependent reductase (Old Yellow Enzyme family)